MKVFITGMAGTLGTALAHLHTERGDHITGCTRSEHNAIKWNEANSHVSGTLYVADACAADHPQSRIYNSVRDADVLYHCAALKHVDLCEQNPVEATRQNVYLTSLLANIRESVKGRFVFVSTDKACLPQSVYGATKLIAEGVTIKTGGMVVRLGNLIGSNGSVFQKWRVDADVGRRLKITDPEMTRYFMTASDAAKFISDVWGNVVTIPYPMRSVRMGDVATKIGWDKFDVIGPRPGETTHQWLVAPGESLTVHMNRITLNGYSPSLGGISSEHTERWDIDELLAITRK